MYKRQAEREPDIESLGVGAIGIMLRAAASPDLETAGAQLKDAFAAAEAVIELGLRHERD